MTQDITPERLLAAYANGYFPMAMARDDATLHWFHPEQRGVLPLDRFHIPRSMAKFLRRAPFRYTINSAFPEVIRACAECTPQRDGTWINDTIIALYTGLWELGHAHSIECWQDNQLVGGLYGVALGGAFFGESMFSRTSNASKAALVYLVERLNAAGYGLLDTQYVNEHLLQFGIEQIPRDAYMRRLEQALSLRPASLVNGD